MSALIMYRSYNPLIWNDFVYKLTSAGREHERSLKVLHQFTRDIIDKRDKEFDVSDLRTRKRIAFLDLLLKAKHADDHKLSLNDIQEEVDTFMFAGHDTTSAAIGKKLFETKMKLIVF